MQIILGATGFFKFNLINADAANYQFLISKKRPHVKKGTHDLTGLPASLLSLSSSKVALPVMKIFSENEGVDM